MPQEPDELWRLYLELKPKAQEINHRDGLVEFKLTQRDGWLLEEDTHYLVRSWGSVTEGDPQIKQSQDWMEVCRQMGEIRGKKDG
jgi:hypothetical protein